jgi:imidazolonepropionase-like amidohydrolase
MHAHLAAPGPVGDAPERYLGHGILAVRDMGGDAASLFALRRSIEQGSRRGPFLYLAGPTLNGESSGSWHLAVPTAEQARIAVVQLRAQGVDFIKIHRAMTREGFGAVIREARQQKLTVAGHVPLAMSFIEASASGMKTVEHVQTLLENEISAGLPAAASADAAMTRLAGARASAIFATLAKNGTYFCPTLVGYEVSWEGNAPARKAAKQALYARMVPLVMRAAGAGVPILAGTDVLSRHGDMLLVELERLVSAGLTPKAALAAATSVPHRLTGRGPGVVAKGREASFLLVVGDPLQDIGNLRRLSAIVLRGELIGSDQLAQWRGAAVRE